jgi:hypothetical protein
MRGGRSLPGFDGPGSPLVQRIGNKRFPRTAAEAGKSIGPAVLLAEGSVRWADFNVGLCSAVSR